MRTSRTTSRLPSSDRAGSACMTPCRRCKRDPQAGPAGSRALSSTFRPVRLVTGLVTPGGRRVALWLGGRGVSRGTSTTTSSHRHRAELHRLVVHTAKDGRPALDTARLNL